MSSYSTLNIGRLQIDSWKNDIDAATMMLFVDTDKRVSPISLEESFLDKSRVQSSVLLPMVTSLYDAHKHQQRFRPQRHRAARAGTAGAEARHRVSS